MVEEPLILLDPAQQKRRGVGRLDAVTAVRAAAGVIVTVFVTLLVVIVVGHRGPPSIKRLFFTPRR